MLIDINIFLKINTLKSYKHSSPSTTFATMKEENDISLFTLSNGLRVVHQKNNRGVAHCGLMVNAGTRDELEGEEGLAHFIEHAIFKGTKNRRTYHILNRLDSVGGELDAFTTKEMTCISASFLTEYYDRAIELISDICLNPTFPEKELEKEKAVVMDEILVYMDSPADQIYDDFESQVFHQHALGNQILGKVKSLKCFDKKTILNYMKRLYHADNMVFTSVGNISEKRLKSKLEKHFSSLSTTETSSPRFPFTPQKVQTIKIQRDSYQTHCMMGKATYGSNHPKRTQLSLLNNLLGGPAMNSILNLRVREKYGYTYNIESNFATYSDAGIFSIYVASDPKYIEKSIQAIYRELKELRNKKLSNNKLHLAKQQLKGQIAIARESYNVMMLSNGKNILRHGRVRTLKEVYQNLDEISADDLQEIAQIELNPQNFNLLFFEGKVSE